MGRIITRSGKLRREKTTLALPAGKLTLLNLGPTGQLVPIKAKVRVLRVKPKGFVSRVDVVHKSNPSIEQQKAADARWKRIVHLESIPYAVGTQAERAELDSFYRQSFNRKPLGPTQVKVSNIFLVKPELLLEEKPAQSPTYSRIQEPLRRKMRERGLIQSALDGYARNRKSRDFVMLLRSRGVIVNSIGHARKKLNKLTSELSGQK